MRRYLRASHDAPVRAEHHGAQSRLVAPLLPLAHRIRGCHVRSHQWYVRVGRRWSPASACSINGSCQGCSTLPTPESEPDWRQRRERRGARAALRLRACGSGELCGLDVDGARSRPRRRRRCGARGEGTAGAVAASRPSTRCGGWLAVSFRCAAARRGDVLFGNERGKPLTASRRAPDPRSPVADADPPARPAPHLRHPPPRRGRRPPRRAGAARSPRRGHHAALHSRQPRAPVGCLPRGPPQSMSIVPEDADLHMQWTRWLNRKNPAAREHLIVHYSPLVKFVAGRVGAGLPSSVDPGDLVSSGVFGLIDAIERFDPERGVKFETFAMPRIRGAVYDGLRELDWVPRSVRSTGPQRRAGDRRIGARLGRVVRATRNSPQHLDISPAELHRWLSSIAIDDDRSARAGDRRSEPSRRLSVVEVLGPVGDGRGPRGRARSCARRSTSCPTVRSSCSRSTTTRA